MRYIVPLAAIAIALPSLAQQHDPSMHSQHMAVATDKPAIKDARQLVKFPAEMRDHTLANMRDHLLALQEIQSALAKSEYDRAADIAEKRLGMSSLALHGAHEVAKFMPQGMQDAGTAMHLGASRFGVTARDAAVSGEIRPAIGALSEVMGACVVCHSGYRLK